MKSLTIPTLPIFLIEGKDVAVFDALWKVIQFVEPIDVINDEYLIYDSEGRKLHFACVSGTGHFFSGPEKVVFEGIETEALHKEELGSILKGFLGHKGIDSNWLSTAGLQDMVNKALEFRLK